MVHARRSTIAANEGAAIGTLRTMCGMFGTFMKKGLGGDGRTYPVGNDPSSKNDGKYCGLYYEGNCATGEPVALIGVADANADLRADGDIDIDGDTGTYNVNSSLATIHQYTFELTPKQGYWFGLMKFYADGSSRHAYDLGFSKEHFGLVAVPAVYGKTGKLTFIMNEEGTIYYQDLGKSEYIDTYPGPGTDRHGWHGWGFVYDEEGGRP
jgi:hypothetical protein